MKPYKPEIIKAEIAKVQARLDKWNITKARVKCPICCNQTMYPNTPKTQVVNCLSRRDNKTYICNLCGMDQALTDYTFNLA